VRDECSTRAVAPKGGRCRVSLETKTLAVVTSDCWLLNLVLKLKEVKSKINDLLSVASADIVESI